MQIYDARALLADLALAVENATPHCYEYRIETVESAQSGASPTITKMRRPDTIMRLNPGEVVYIGDMTWDVAAFPATLVSYSRNDAAARSAFGAYPGIRGEPTYRQLSLRTQGSPNAPKSTTGQPPTRTP